jgi:hypothetical protein
MIAQAAYSLLKLRPTPTPNGPTCIVRIVDGAFISQLCMIDTVGSSMGESDLGQLLHCPQDLQLRGPIRFLRGILAHGALALVSARFVTRTPGSLRPDAPDGTI